jgi:hypothetical protein
MGIADSVKTSIYNAFDNIFGSDITVNTVSVVYDSRGDKTETTTSTKVVKAAYSGNNPFKKSLQKIGEVNEGGMRLYAKSDDLIIQGNVISFDGSDYDIKNVGLLGFANVKIVDVFELTKRL